MKTMLACMALLTLSLSAQAQTIAKKLKKATAIEVTYQSSYKGQVRPGKMTMRVLGNQVALESAPAPRAAETRPADTDRPVMKQPIQKSYMDYGTNKSYRFAELPDGRCISTTVPFTVGKTTPTQDFKEELGEDTYLGLKCKKVRSIVNSNTIDIWYTQELAFRGTPQSNVGVPDGLVLRVVRNGDTVQEAVDINPLKVDGSLLPSTWGENMDSYEYTYEINHCNELVYTVFDQQTIAFTGSKLGDNLKSGEIYSAGGGTIILKKVKLPDYVKDRDCFVEV
ncbi:MAG: glpgli family protein, partial [Bacteroidaceae bacterium]|nr:glpgli family protein [Bacteroidaceae bacterium]